MSLILHLEERPYTKEYRDNNWLVSTSLTPTNVNEKTGDPRDVLLWHDSFSNTTRGLMLQTVKQDIEIVCAFYFYGFYYVLVGVFVKASDVEDFFMPTSKFYDGLYLGILSCNLCCLRISVDDYNYHSYMDTHYDPSKNPFMTRNWQHDLYKHILYDIALNYQNAVLIESNVNWNALYPNILQNVYANLKFGYAPSWFAHPSRERMVFLAAPGNIVLTAGMFAEIANNKNVCNVGYIIYDGNSVENIVSNSDVIRGNIWAQAEEQLRS